MNWDAIGALSELFGAAAVVASLIYLAKQLKMTRQVEQVSAFQAVFDGFTHHTAQFFAAPEDLALRGLTDRSGLGESDRLKFDQLLSNVLNQLEMTGSLTQAGLMSEDELQPVDWWLEDKLFCYPGAREWLEDFERFYPPAYFDRMKRAADAASTKAVTGSSDSSAGDI